MNKNTKIPTARLAIFVNLLIAVFLVGLVLFPGSRAPKIMGWLSLIPLIFSLLSIRPYILIDGTTLHVQSIFKNKTMDIRDLVTVWISSSRYQQVINLIDNKDQKVSFTLPLSSNVAKEIMTFIKPHIPEKGGLQNKAVLRLLKKYT